MRLAQADGNGYLPAARLIADRITGIIHSDMGITAERAVQMASNAIDPAQRFYDVEYNQASLLLAAQFPYVQQSGWRVLLQNYMGYRLVEMPICRYGYVVDPVARECVKEYVPPEPTPEPPPHEEEEEKAGISGGVLLLVGILAFAFLRGR